MYESSYDNCDYIVDQYAEDLRNSAILVGLCFLFSLVFLITAVVTLTQEPYMPPKQETWRPEGAAGGGVPDPAAGGGGVKGGGDLSWVDDESSGIALGHRQGPSLQI